MGCEYGSDCHYASNADQGCGGSELDPCGVTNSGSCGPPILAACQKGATCTADTDCLVAQSCDATSGTCVAEVCQADTDCPVNFTCAQGACARKACSQDSECQGVCSHNLCVSKLGTCLDCF